MIRPIMEYGDVIFDGAPENHLKILEGVQREAAITCTGANRRTSSVPLLWKLGWEPLSLRRYRHKACMMFKIQNRLVPNYLSDHCPPLVQQVVAYNLRNQEAIQLPQVRTESYRKSFFPSSIKIWNSLDNSLRNASSIISFKNSLNRDPHFKSNRLYSNQTGRSSVHQTRIRLGLSALNGQRFNYGLIDIFFDCPSYALARAALLQGLDHLNIDIELPNRLSKVKLASTLLHGDSHADCNINNSIFCLVQTFIAISLRFVQ